MSRIPQYALNHKMLDKRNNTCTGNQFTIMVLPKMMTFIGYTEITEVETTGI